MCFKETYLSIRDIYLLAYTLMPYPRIFWILQEFHWVLYFPDVSVLRYMLVCLSFCWELMKEMVSDTDCWLCWIGFISCVLWPPSFRTPKIKVAESQPCPMFLGSPFYIFYMNWFFPWVFERHKLNMPSFIGPAETARWQCSSCFLSLH